MVGPVEELVVETGEKKGLEVSGSNTENVNETEQATVSGGTMTVVDKVDVTDFFPDVD